METPYRHPKCISVEIRSAVKLTGKVNLLTGELRVELDDSWAERHCVKRTLKFLAAMATVEVLQSSHESHSAVKR